jgi:hypothetical protein
MKQPARKRYIYDVEAREKAFLKRLNTGFFGLCYRASNGKIDELCDYLAADKPLTEEDKQNIAWLIRKVHVDGMPRKKGRRPATRIGLVQRAVSYGVGIFNRERQQWLAKNPGHRRNRWGFASIVRTPSFSAGSAPRVIMYIPIFFGILRDLPAA